MRKMVFKINTHNGISFLFALTGLVWMEPYFVWESYSVALYYVKYILILLVIGFMFLRIISTKPDSKWKAIVFVGFCVIAAYIFLTNTTKSFNAVLSEVLKCGCIGCFVLLRDEEQAKSFNYLETMFVWLLIPSLLSFSLVNMGFNLPHSTLLPLNVLKGINYDHYPFLVTLPTSSRFMGILDEPGAIGTFCALILAKDGFRNRINYKKIVLIIAGVLSASFAFFLLIIIVLIIRIIQYKSWKKIVLVAVALICMYLFFNIDFPSGYLARTQERVLSNWLSDRTSNYYIFEWMKYWQSDARTVLLGMGLGAKESNYDMAGGSSWMDLLYNFGVVGFTGILLLVIPPTYILYIKRCKYVIPLLLTFVASIYQRPMILQPVYLIILFGGAASICIADSAKKHLTPAQDTIRQ